MKRAVGRFVAGVLVAGITGCAGASQEKGAAAPAPPSVAASPPPPPSPIVAEAVPAAPPAMAVAPSAGGARGGAEERARVDVATAQRELDASMGNCSAACRALGSMDRATGQLCALATSSEDARVCDESKGRLIAARTRVRAACGSCPAGPSVDANAPVPSP